jgi:hypothetical protein
MRPFVQFAMLLAVTAPAAAEPLAVKTGLWEMSIHIHIQGPLLSPETLAKIPPALRAQIEAATGAITQPRTTKTCLTEEKLRRGFDFQGHHNKCDPHIISQTSTSMEVEATCNETSGTSHMRAHFIADDRETMHGGFTVDRVAAEGPKHVDAEVSARFLAPICAGAETGDD